MDHARMVPEAVPTPPKHSGAQKPPVPVRLTPEALARPGSAERAVFARTLRRAGNAAAARHLARQPQTTPTRPPTLKEKVEEARRTDPRAYVLKAVQGMAAAGTWGFEEQAAEITWRMIHMFLVDRINTTLVQADPNAQGVELAASAPRGVAQIVVGPNFIKGITANNLDDRVAILRLVFLGKDAIIAKLKADFGFESVVNGNREWTGGELAVVHVALSKLPQADRAALVGVTLRRDMTLTHQGQPRAGEFEWHVSAVAAGTSTKPTLTHVLKLADSAFIDLDQASEITVHEAGHAVETDKLRRARLAAGIAVADLNAAGSDLTNASQAAQGSLTGAVNRSNGYQTADRNAANGFVQATIATHNAILAFANGPTATAAALETAADNAVRARNTARAALPAGNPADHDFARAVELQDDFLAAAKVFVPARAARDRTAAAVTAARGQVNTNITRRLERFRAIVLQHNIQPITPYAQQNWPAHPEEFFAEAYTKWRHDPANLPLPLRQFFDNGEHLR